MTSAKVLDKTRSKLMKRIGETYMRNSEMYTPSLALFQSNSTSNCVGIEELYQIGVIQRVQSLNNIERQVP
jgi:hypothetical protein